MSIMRALEDYRQELFTQERAEATISKYIHDIRAFLAWSEAHHTDSLTKVQVLRWRDTQAQSSAPATVNAAVAAMNGFLRFIGRGDCCVRPLRVQRILYRERRMELTREEYFRLLRAAEQVSEQTVCMLETLCVTDIRVSELRYVTVQAVRQGFTTVRNKGKCRTILLPRRLQTLLKRYYKTNK